jgi:PucR family transcriptional regulator, purine catabolism regulatory protein
VIPGEETIRVVASRSTGRPDEGDGVLASFGGFTADRDDLRVTVLPASAGPAAAAALAARGHAAVVSAAVPWIALPTALRQVQQLLVDEVPAGTTRSFDELVARGLFGVLRQHEGALVAEALLAPARRSEDGLRLLDSARVWLQHNGSFDPAARELGIHRHTLRTRVESLGGLVGLDLDRFSDRAELWSALRLAGLSSGGSPG